MFGQLLMVLAGILALIGAGAFSYTYIGDTFAPRETVQQMPVVEKKETTKATSTQATTKKTAPKATTVAETNGSLVPKTAVVEKLVVAPGPLRAVSQAPSTADLTVSGIIERTNIERAQNGDLSALTENTLLNRDAQMKVDDMFAKQYFEHVSTSHPRDLVLQTSLKRLGMRM